MLGISLLVEVLYHYAKSTKPFSNLVGNLNIDKAQQWCVSRFAWLRHINCMSKYFFDTRRFMICFSVTFFELGWLALHFKFWSKVSDCLTKHGKVKLSLNRKEVLKSFLLLLTFPFLEIDVLSRSLLTQAKDYRSTSRLSTGSIADLYIYVKFKGSVNKYTQTNIHINSNL